MKIAVLTDSGSGMNQSEAQEQGIFYLPLQVLKQEEQYLDGITIDLHQVYQYLHEEQQMSTSMPPMGMIEQTLKQMKDEGIEAVICVPITAGLSSTSSVLTAVAQDVGIKLYMVETYTTCYLQRYLAECAKKLVDQGLDAETIVNRLQTAIDDSDTLIIPDDLQHLKRGGRLTPVAAALGSLLKIKPILQLNSKSAGKIDVYDKVRTMSRAQQRALDTFAAAMQDENYVVSCLHTDAPKACHELYDKMIAMMPGRQFYFGYIGAVISVHTGIGCMGIQYIRKVEGCE